MGNRLEQMLVRQKVSWSEYVTVRLSVPGWVLVSVQRLGFSKEHLSVSGWVLVSVQRLGSSKEHLSEQRLALGDSLGWQWEWH
jgi:hypothetical protein